MTNAAPGSPRPKESLFYEPLIYLLGKLSGFKPYVGVRHELVQDDVLRLAGIDPEDCPWPLQSSSSKKRDGLYRVIHFAWYHQTRMYRPSTDALCAKPMLPELSRLEEEMYEILGVTEDESSVLRDAGTDPAEKRRIRAKIKTNTTRLSRQHRSELEDIKKQIRGFSKRGEWALTEKGVRRARALKERYEGKIVLSAGPNTTARLIGDNFEVLYDRITQHLRRKMPLSEALGKIEDHAMNWIDRTIQRDGLRSRVEQGKPVYPSQVQAWARRSAYTDIRDEGQDPVCRSLHGTLTRREIPLHDVSNWTEVHVPRTLNESDRCATNTRIYTAFSKYEPECAVMENLIDDGPLSCPEDVVVAEDTMAHIIEKVSNLVKDRIEEDLDPEMHQQLVVQHFVQEMTVREIAEASGITDERDVAASLNRVRDVLVEAREMGEFDDLISRR